MSESQRIGQIKHGLKKKMYITKVQQSGGCDRETYQHFLGC
jgi:hypothetical protein